MSEIKRKKRCLSQLLKACAISAFAFLLSWLLIYDFTSLSYFAPMEKASDFLASDFYNLVAQNRKVKSYDDRIAVVSIDGLSRPEIAETFRAISEGQPKVLAVDVFFEERGDDTDIDLAESLSGLPMVIYPIAASSDEGGVISGPSIYNYLDNVEPGVVNLDINSNRNTVRTFKSLFLEGDRAEESLAYAAAKAFKGGDFDDFSTSESYDIDYNTVEFDTFEASEIINDPDLINSRLVFVGELQNPTDMHATPLENSVPGVMIHACSASTILNDLIIKHVPGWVIGLISALLSIFFIYAQLTLCDSKAGNMLMRWLQAGILLLLIVAGTFLFIDYRISFDLSLPLTMITLGLLACDLWMLLETAPGWWKFIKSKLNAIKIPIFKNQLKS